MAKLSVEGIRTLDRVGAQQLVQQKMAQAMELLGECEQIMDVHRFTAELPTEPRWSQLRYLPRNLTREERLPVYSMEENNLTWCGINEEYKDGGQWVSSSQYGDCDQ